MAPNEAQRSYKDPIYPTPERSALEPREHAVAVRGEDEQYDYAAPTCPRFGDQWIQIHDWLRLNRNHPMAEARYSCHHCDRSFIAFAPKGWRPLQDGCPPSIERG